MNLDTATIWSAPAERSGDGAFAPRACVATLKAVSRSAATALDISHEQRIG